MGSAFKESAATNVPEELLSAIFKNLIKRDQASAARVCNQWSGAALDQLWYSLDSLLPVLHLLGPTTISESKIDIPNSLEDVDWGRFSLLTRRTRRLSWTADSVFSDHLCAQLLLHQPTYHHMLPSLLEVTWEAHHDEGIEQILLVTSPSLNTLRLYLPDYSEDALRLIFRGLNIQSILLSEFSLTCNGEGEVKTEVGDFICGQLRLRHISLPFFFGTSKIVAALGRLKELESVGVTKWNLSRGDDVEWRFHPGQFPRLSKLGFATKSLMEAAEIFIAHSLAQLCSVSIATDNMRPDHPGLAVFLPALVRCCPRLSEVCLIIHHDEGNFIEEIGGEDYMEPKSFSFSDPEPPLQYTELSSLEVYHNYSIVLRKEDISRMSQSWPCLQHLHLTADPIHDQYVTEDLIGTPLSMLATFVAHGFPNLRHLGLYFHIDCTDAFDTFALSTLPNLQTLAVGTSQVLEGHRVATAAFLASLVELGVLIEAGYSVHAECNLIMYDKEALLRPWKDVAHLMHHMHMSQKALRYQLEVAKTKHSL
ncbi:hypothetical protein FRB94_010368 [Tulasnella sp. JGI-2019a]|nr:hypothetical protein FRB94_010368 [Tulasnella sp. JGI-2019a]